MLTFLQAAIAKTPGLVRGLSAVLSLPYSCTRALGHAVRLLALVAQDTALHLEIAASGALAPIARLLHSVASCLRRSVAAPLDTASSHAAVSLLARLSSSKFRRHDLICASGAVEALVAVLNSVPDSKGVAAAQSILQQGALLVLLPLAQAGQSARQLHQAGAAMAVMGMALRDRVSWIGHLQFANPTSSFLPIGSMRSRHCHRFYLLF